MSDPNHEIWWSEGEEQTRLKNLGKRRWEKYRKQRVSGWEEKKHLGEREETRTRWRKRVRNSSADGRFPFWQNPPNMECSKWLRVCLQCIAEACALSVRLVWHLASVHVEKKAKCSVLPPSLVSSPLLPARMSRHEKWCWSMPRGNSSSSHASRPTKSCCSAVSLYTITVSVLQSPFIVIITEMW